MENTRTVCIAAVPWLDNSRVPEILGALTTLTVLATMAVILRFFARRVAGASYGADDWLILLALVVPAFVIQPEHQLTVASLGNLSFQLFSISVSCLGRQDISSLY